MYIFWMVYLSSSPAPLSFFWAVAVRLKAINSRSRRGRMVRYMVRGFSGKGVRSGWFRTLVRGTDR